jgi:hypothetical protein
MVTSGEVDSPTRRWILSRRAAVALWLVLGGVLWNVVFDTIVVQGGRDYLAREQRHEQGIGPAVTIHGVMDKAVARGGRTATAIGGGVAAVGLTLVWVAGRRRVRALARRGE